MKNRLSYTAINTYQTCGYKYKLRYLDKLRSKYFHAALGYGSAIDSGLNKLLTTKDVEQAKNEFNKLWQFQWVNKKYVDLSKYELLVYAESDFDAELLQEEDNKKIWDWFQEKVLNFSTPFDVKTEYDCLLALKKEQGWDNLTLIQKQYFNYINWLSLRRKGHIMIESYNKKILPQIQEVLAVQKETRLTNSEGDEVVQYLDLIVRWKDGKNILMDNKTSTRDYEKDSASRSPQLVSYFFGAKEEFKLDAVGFLVLKKLIMKNRIKICKSCGHDGSGGRHKTCDSVILGKRCGGEWNETISPECYIDVIINDVAPTVESLVVESFNEANNGIKKEHYPKNLSACKNGPIICEFMGKCWYNNEAELINTSQIKYEKL